MSDLQQATVGLEVKSLKESASSVTKPWIAENVVKPELRTYWMSEINSGEEEWITISYDQPFVAKSVSIVLNNGRQGTNPVIQGSHDGIIWNKIAKVNVYDYPNDDRNFRHINMNLDNDNEYSHYRYHSDPTVYVLIEYLSFSKNNIVLNPVKEKASSETKPWVAQNVIDSEPRTYWMSEVDSEDPQWITVSYNQPFAAKSATIIIGNGRQGTRPVIQGSTDGINWITLAKVNSSDYPNDERNFRHVCINFENTKKFNHYRYYSYPTVYVLIEYLEFSDSKTAVKAIKENASSVTQPWIAQNVIKAEPRTYWMSEVNSKDPQWVTITYNQPFIAQSASIVLNNGRQGTNPVLQGSIDGVNWVDLAKVSAFDYPNDERNFRHINMNIDNDKAYCYYRYYSDPTVYVLIEHMAFSEDKIEIESIDEKASSVTQPWVAHNVVNQEPRTFWMSEVNSKEPQWVSLSYNEEFVATKASIVLNNGRQGTNPVLQGSTDGKSWTNLAQVHAFDYPNDERNFRHVNMSFENDKPYKHYRYYSEPTVYVLIEYIKFSE